MATYNVAEAKNRLPALIGKAIEGEEVVITRHQRSHADHSCGTGHVEQAIIIVGDFLLG